LIDFAERFGGNDPLVKHVLAGKSPQARAIELISGTKLKGVDFRKNLYAKNPAALEAAHDPMLDLARTIDAPAREARRAHDAQEEIKRQAYAERAKAGLVSEGMRNHPEGTFRLRYSYGQVDG